MKIFKNIFFSGFIFLALLGLSACTSHGGFYPFLYHPALSQGNVINDNAVNQLSIGMSGEQVTALMGSPILETPLSPNTWRYVYTLREKDKLTQHKQVILYFSHNRLVQIEK